MNVECRSGCEVLTKKEASNARLWHAALPLHARSVTSQRQAAEELSRQPPWERGRKCKVNF